MTMNLKTNGTERENTMITKYGLIGRYLIAVDERNALQEGTLTEEETAGYWLYEASHNPRGEFNYMLEVFDILLSEDKFYSKVNDLLKEVGI